MSNFMVTYCVMRDAVKTVTMLGSCLIFATFKLRTIIQIECFVFLLLLSVLVVVRGSAF